MVYTLQAPKREAFSFLVTLCAKQPKLPTLANGREQQGEL